MYIRKIKGPTRAEPCGTPRVSVEVLHLKPITEHTVFHYIDKVQTTYLQLHIYHNDQVY